MKDIGERVSLLSLHHISLLKRRRNGLEREDLKIPHTI